MRYYIIAFIILLVGYLSLPKDMAVANPPVAPMDQVTSVDRDGNGCITIHEAHAVGKNDLPVQIVKCNK